MGFLGRKLVNVIQYTPPGGQRVNLSPLANSDIITEEGTGMPPIEHITEQGPFEHGVTPKDYRLQPRIVSYRLRQQFCSLGAYYTGRSALLDLLRPNYDPNVITGTVTKYLPNGQVRSLDVAILDGPLFKAKAPGAWDEWAIDEVIRFIAFNPIAYGPTQQTHIVSCETTEFTYTFPIYFSCENQLVFPITFPITFEHFDLGGIIEYDGNWPEYPQIVITGPVSDYVKIENVTTGMILELISANGFPGLAVGETITFNLTYSVKTIVDSNGNNVIGYLSDDSDLSEFSIVPGDNEIRVIMYGHGAGSQVAFNYYNRYIGY